MKTLTFSVSLTFSESVERDEDILEIMKNALSALVREIDNGMGLVPDGADWFTTKIEISESYSELRTTHDFLSDKDINSLEQSKNLKL